MKHYTVTVKAFVSVLAEDFNEAEAIVQKHIEPVSDYLPRQFSFDCMAYYTPNQSDEIKRRAINFEEQA